jgi:hypothetical protein
MTGFGPIVDFDDKNHDPFLVDEEVYGHVEDIYSPLVPLREQAPVHKGDLMTLLGWASDKRYDIASYTQCLVTNADGSVDILVQNEPPANSSSNWLPAPKGSFRLHGRAYGPRAPLLYVIYKWPAIRVV